MSRLELVDDLLLAVVAAIYLVRVGWDVWRVIKRR